MQVQAGNRGIEYDSANLVKRLVLFFFATFAVAWALFAAAGRFPSSANLLVFLGAISPALVGIALSASDGGVPRLLEAVLRWQVGARWYLFALLFMGVIRIGVALAHRMLTGAWPDLIRDSWALLPFAILLGTPVQAGEEIGWRGFALPRLLRVAGFAWSAILLGMIWAVWHLPLFYLAIPGNNEYGRSFPIWALSVTALSVAFAWLYVRTGGSLLLTMLMHAAVNNLPHFTPTAGASPANVFSMRGSLTEWLLAGCLWIAAAGFWIEQGRRGSRPS